MIVVALVTGLLVGLLILVLVLRGSTAHASAASDDAVAAAVSAALAERVATAEVLERDREATMMRAAEMVDQKLDARLRQGTEQMTANIKMGTEKFAAGTTAVEKQTAEMAAEMRRMQKMMSELQEKTAGQHGAVVSQLREAALVTGQLQQTTGSLRDALGSAKKRGNWGERMAADVLAAAGMTEGLNFRAQKGIDSGGRPDFTILMPRQMVLHMDVKFPVDNYLRFLEASEDASSEADGHRKQFVKDAKNRVKELAARRYHEESESVDTVVLFIPNESVFAFVQENDPTLLDDAMKQKIVLCGPSTLIAVLQIVRQAMDNFMLERRSNEIMECLSGFKTEWEKFSAEVDRHGKQLATAQKSFDSLAGTRSNQLQRQLNRIDELQVARESDDDEETGAELSEWPPLRGVASA